MDLVVPLLTLVVVLGVAFAIRVLRRRAGRPVPAIPWMRLIAYLAVTAAVMIAANVPTGRGGNGVLRTLLAALPLLVYVVYAVYWLVRNRREIVAGWRAESAEDRKRGLTGRRG